jgi:hypothetical protein
MTNADEIKITTSLPPCKQTGSSERVREEDESWIETSEKGYSAEEATVGFFEFQRKNINPKTR